jgi:hypothetical protein
VNRERMLAGRPPLRRSARQRRFEEAQEREPSPHGAAGEGE